MRCQATSSRKSSKRALDPTVSSTQAIYFVVLGRDHRVTPVFLSWMIVSRVKPVIGIADL